jgi:Uri superfamily endonuclease
MNTFITHDMDFYWIRCLFTVIHLNNHRKFTEHTKKKGKAFYWKPNSLKVGGILSMFSSDSLPAKGIYTLILFISSGAEFVIGKLGTQLFSKGYYTYTGSALGNGASSLKNRISRHLLTDKRKFWHIDFLLAHEDATVISIIVAKAEKKYECEINHYIKEKGKAQIPFLGFGSSDCRERCKSHLLYFGETNPERKIDELYTQKFKLHLFLRI